jgi:glycine/serine hydroxymethyltransferase
MRQLADWMDQVASKPDDEKTLKRVREEVRELCREFPLYGEYEL